MLEKILLLIILILLLYFIYLYSNKKNYKKKNKKKIITYNELSDSVLEIIDDIFDEYNLIRQSKELSN